MVWGSEVIVGMEGGKPTGQYNRGHYMEIRCNYPFGGRIYGNFPGFPLLEIALFGLVSYEQPPLFGKERNSLWMETFFFQIHLAYGNEVGGN